ncbi:butyrate kinase [candidate division KSB1 bacterium]|nr:butyrate kinase [candidate division KSB1 bacterium]
MNYKILVINPGSTSTKLALFENEHPQFQKSISHPAPELAQFTRLWDQLDYRLRAITDFLNENHLSITDLAAIVGRGGLLKPLPGGTYAINRALLADAEKGLQGDHAANLGGALAWRLAEAAHLPAYVVDPISVDEFEPLARYSGHPMIERRSLSHTLNIHAVGRQAARHLGVNFETTNFIIAHLGGGISICPLKGGRIIDVNDASSDGPFSPERTGGLPLQPFIKLCFSGQYTTADMKKMVMGAGGLTAYLNTNDAREIERRIQAGDRQAEEVYQAMAYQIAKEIGAMSTVLGGALRAIVISGGLASSAMLVQWIRERVAFIAEILVFPGELEMEALAEGALRVLRGLEAALIY